MRNKKALKSLMLLLTVVSAPSAAQQLLLKGSITDGGTGDALPWATVIIMKADSMIAMCYTDSSGKYNFTVTAEQEKAIRSMPRVRVSYSKHGYMSRVDEFDPAELPMKEQKRLTLYPSPTWVAQKPSGVFGYITEKSTKYIIQYGTVTLHHNGLVVGKIAPDYEGRYFIPVAPGKYVVSVEVPGYTSFKSELFEVSDHVVQMDVELEWKAIRLKEVKPK
jgi:hypothetical protein